MRPGGPAALALASLRHSPGRPALTGLALGVALALPLFTWRAAELLERRLLARAEATPAVMGAPGSPLDLLLLALWFEGEVADTLPVSAAEAARPYGLALPLHLAHRAGGRPVVGAPPEYLEARGLRVARGRRAALLGEAVVGARAAEAAGIEPGDRLRVDQARLLDLSAEAPLTLEVVGVLAPSGGPEDGALLVDLRTAWALDGHLHGHAPLDAEAPPEAGAAAFLDDELDAARRARFHAHADLDALPVHAILVFPDDARALDQLLGDDALDPSLSVLRPAPQVRGWLRVILRVEALVRAALVAAVLACGALAAGVTALSLRLRADELALLRRLGAGPGALATLVGVELGATLAWSAALAASLVAAGLAALDHLLLNP